MRKTTIHTSKSQQDLKLDAFPITLSQDLFKSFQG